jgi:DNA processing protein
LALVVAGGVDVPYYSTDSSRRLLEDTAAVGCVLSESPPGTPHTASLFRRRNTILTGLSVGLLCVEAASRSGTLGVASLAAEQGRDLFAIPANLGSPQSQGTNDLLRSGLAAPVVSASDILSRYDYLLPRKGSQPKRDFTRWKVVKVPAAVNGSARSRQERRAEQPAKKAEHSPADDEKRVDTFSKSRYIELLDHSDRWSEEERSLLKALADGPATTEALIAATGLNAGLVSASLIMLAVNGAVEECSGGQFRLIPQGLG